MKSVREAVVERDAEWSKRVDRYRRAANDARADRDADRAAWAVERASLRDDRAIRASSASIERLRRDVRALKRSCRDLRSSAELAKRLVGPAVERALEGALDAPLRPAAGARVSYVAVAGGVDCPAWFGGRGTLVATGLGGWQGRPLRPGDALPLGAAGTLPAAAQGRLVAPAPDANSVTALRVYPGPDAAMLGAALQAALWRQLLATCWRVGRASDRSGTVLEGPPLALPQGVAEAAASAPSRPMVAGAIQLPPSGQPIVLGPDHPVTGGYPLIGVLRRQDLGALQLRCPGAALRLRAA